MAKSDRDIPQNLQPRPADYQFDLESTLRGIVSLRAGIPNDAFTASALGTERDGSGVVIAGGLVLTMGYLVLEAETIWLTTARGGAVQGHALGVDAESGFAVVQPLGRLDAPALEFSTTQGPEVGSTAILAAQGGMTRAIETHVVAPPGVRRLLGVRARRRDLHRARAPVLGRRRPDRPRRPPARRGVADPAAGRRAWPSRRHEHDRADRAPVADPGRPAHAGPGQPPRRAPGSASTPWRTTTRSWSAASPMAARRRRQG